MDCVQGRRPASHVQASCRSDYACQSLHAYHRMQIRACRLQQASSSVQVTELNLQLCITLMCHQSSVLCICSEMYNTSGHTHIVVRQCGSAIVENVTGFGLGNERFSGTDCADCKELVCIFQRMLQEHQYTASSFLLTSTRRLSTFWP